MFFRPVQSKPSWDSVMTVMIQTWKCLLCCWRLSLQLQICKKRRQEIRGSFSFLYHRNRGLKCYKMFLCIQIIKQIKEVHVTYLLEHFLTVYLTEELIYNQTFWKFKPCVYGVSGIAEVKCQGTSLGHGDINGILLPARHTPATEMCKIKSNTFFSFLSLDPFQIHLCFLSLDANQRQ